MPAKVETQNDAVSSHNESPNFYELLEAIRLRPAMCLGRKSLHDFNGWVAGYRIGKAHSGASTSTEEQELREFDEFIQEKCRWHDVGGWAAKIAYYHRDDSAALDEFFKLFDEFQESKHQNQL